MNLSVLVANSSTVKELSSTFLPFLEFCFFLADTKPLTNAKTPFSHAVSCRGSSEGGSGGDFTGPTTPSQLDSSIRSRKRKIPLLEGETMVLIL